jgi:hypothetical protein
VSAEPSREELEAAHCWEDGDHVPGKPEMTAFRRRVRLHQARWREAQGLPIGSQPIAPVGASRPVGNRLPLDYARETGANFVTPAALAAVRARMSFVEPEQSFDHQRLWAELLWAPALTFNLFGDLAADVQRADRAVHAWWPDTPGTVTEVRFAHSPGRLDPAWLNSLRAFDAAFILALDDGTHGVVAVDVNYNDWLKPETPKPTNLARNLEVATRSGAFAPRATDQVKGRSPLAVMWLEHLLLHSMLQHATAEYTWGRYVVVFPAGNVDVAAGCDRYRGLLADDSTFATATLESLIGSGALPRRTASALRARYVADG